MAYYRQNDTVKLRRLVDSTIESGFTQSLSLGEGMIGFFLLGLDGVEAALPWLEKALQAKDLDLLWNFLFYLPERMSDEPDWLAFWDQPGLKEVLDMRRVKPYPTYGLWQPNSELNGVGK